MVLLICVVTFGAVTLVVAHLLQPRENTVQRRILEASTANELPQHRRSEGSPSQRLLMPVVRGLRETLSRLLPQNFLKHIEELMVQAAWTGNASAFSLMWLTVSVAAFVLAALVLRSLQSTSLIAAMFLAAFILFYGIIAPYLLLRVKAGGRKREIERTLPDATDLVVTCVEAGMSVDAAFALVAQRGQGPLSVLFTEYLRDVGFGRARHEALEGLATRSGSSGLRTLSSMVSQSLSIGTSLGDVLRTFSAELRTIRRLRAREAAGRAPIWMTIPLAFCFIPAMAVVILVPTVFTIIDSVNKSFGN